MSEMERRYRERQAAKTLDHSTEILKGLDVMARRVRNTDAMRKTYDAASRARDEAAKKLGL